MKFLLSLSLASYLTAATTQLPRQLRSQYTQLKRPAVKEPTTTQEELSEVPQVDQPLLEEVTPDLPKINEEPVTLGEVSEVEDKQDQVIERLISRLRAHLADLEATAAKTEQMIEQVTEEILVITGPLSTA